MNNNEAFFCKLGNIKPIEGADKIVTAEVLLKGVTITQVIVGKDTQEGTEVAYFDSNLVITPEFILAVDRLSPDFGKEGFTSLGAYLSKNRVKCVRLRKQISNGLAVDFAKIKRIFKDVEFEEGVSFTKLGNMEICKKWFPASRNLSQPGSKQRRNAKKRVSRVIPEQFSFYVDTSQLLRNLFAINPYQVGSISRKLHGTSWIVSNALVKRKLTLRDKIAKLFGVKVQMEEYDNLYASRTVIKNDSTASEGFYKVDIWTDIGKKFFEGKLKTGETVYGEAVGYLPDTQTFIQKNYDYGCKPGDYEIYVYRITRTAADGTVTSLDWSAMKARCWELDVKMVPELFYGRFADMYKDIPVDDDWQKNFAERLKVDFLEKDVEGNLCKKMPDEGIVLRVEGLNISVFKLKSERFFEAESKAKEDENNIDIEEQEASLVQ